MSAGKGLPWYPATKTSLLELPHTLVHWLPCTEAGPVGCGVGVGWVAGGDGVGATGVEVTVGGSGLAVGGTGVTVAAGASDTGEAMGALQPTTNNMINTNPIAGCNIWRLILPSFRGDN